MPDKDLIIIKWKGTTEESALLPELVTIEYAGQQIFLENGKIRVETIEEPEEPSSFCEIWNDCKLRFLSGGCLPDAQCVHRVKPARRPNMPAGMQL